MTDLPETGSEVTQQPGVARPTRYQGNTNDIVALSAAVSGLSLCAYMATNGLFCCLPVLLGIAGLAMAGSAEDPQRARNLSLVGIGTVGCMFLFFLACIALYFAFMAIVAISSGQGGRFN